MEIVNLFQSFHWTEIIAIITGLIYVWLASKLNPCCWVWGIISCALWAYATFVLYDLYADAFLQVFYVGMGFWGLYAWMYKNPKANEKIQVSKLAWPTFLRAAVVILVITVLTAEFLNNYTSAAATYLDAFTTVISIYATYLTVQKVLENWLFWILADLLYVYLYWSRAGYLFALVFVLYTLIAIKGYIQWRKSYDMQISKPV